MSLSLLSILLPGRTKFFRGGPDGVDADVSIIDAAVASAAAPTYFPAHVIGTELYADGGLIANSPDVLAAIEAVNQLGWSPRPVRLFTIGTTQFSPALAGSQEPKKWGAAEGLSDHRLLKLAMAAQIELSRGMARSILGENNVLIVDPILSSDQNEIVGLDKVTTSAVATLQAIAQRSYRSSKTSETSKRFLELCAYTARIGPKALLVWSLQVARLGIELQDELGFRIDSTSSSPRRSPRDTLTVV